jgi:hypothetical protein
MYSLSNKEQFDAAVKDVVGIVCTNLEKQFKDAIAFRVEQQNNGNVIVYVTKVANDMLNTDAIVLTPVLGEGIITTD